MKPTIAVISALLLAGASVSAAQASPNLVSKKFANCTELNKVYPGGVTYSAKVVNKGGETKRTPKVNAKVYKENIGKDRDKDGIACEK